MSFLVDTYALMEWYVQGNSHYEPYFRADTKRHLTKLTLMEFYCQVYHRMGKRRADEFHRHLKAYSQTEELTEEIIRRAAVFRSQVLNRGKKRSYSDSVNYVTAKHISAKLLTGEVEFKGLRNVEYVR